MAKEKRDKEAASKTMESVLSIIQEEFTCAICQELFVNAYTLSCSHSYCELCIKEWTKSKRQQECPTCRKVITSDPVPSRALDNAISNIVKRMNQRDQEERKAVLKQHTESLKKLGATSATKSTTSSHHAKSTTSVPPTMHGQIPGRRTGPKSNPTGPIPNTGEYYTDDNEYYTDDDEYYSDDDEYYSDEEDYSDEDDWDYYDDEDSDSAYVEGLPGAYYGGYGRCFHCGYHGHWIIGCPYY